MKSIEEQEMFCPSKHYPKTELFGRHIILSMMILSSSCGAPAPLSSIALMDDGHQHTNPRVSPLLQVPCVLQQQIRSYIDANIWEIQNYHWQKKII
jgi:hypothetical protein